MRESKWANFALRSYRCLDARRNDEKQLHARNHVIAMFYIILHPRVEIQKVREKFLKICLF